LDRGLYGSKHVCIGASSSAEADDTTALAVLIHIILLKMHQIVSSSRHSDDISERWQQEVNQLIFEILFETKWRQCLWCWKRGMDVHDFMLPDGVIAVTYHDSRDCYLCDTCSDLEEPPWYPNARRRCAQSLKHIMPQSLRGNDEVLATMSAFVIGNDP